MKSFAKNGRAPYLAKRWRDAWMHCFVLLMFACGVVAAQEPPIRLRGTVEKFRAPELIIKERSGELITLSLPDETGMAEVIPSDVTSIQPGTFIGTAALPRADGKLTALEVVVFPEVARGAGEGHFPWDLEPQSSMTNGTVAELTRSTDGRTLRLRYKDGEKTVVIPDGIPVVTLRQGERSLLVPGANVFIVAELTGQHFLVRRLLVGRNGVKPPM